MSSELLFIGAFSAFVLLAEIVWLIVLWVKR